MLKIIQKIKTYNTKQEILPMDERLLGDTPQETTGKKVTWADQTGGNNLEKIYTYEYKNDENSTDHQNPTHKTTRTKEDYKWTKSWMTLNIFMLLASTILLHFKMKKAALFVFQAFAASLSFGTVAMIISELYRKVAGEPENKIARI